MIHIKPTADRASIHQFRANFIRFFRDVKEGRDKDGFDALSSQINADTGIIETVHTIAEETKAIIKRHTDACRLEVMAYLKDVADQLRIEL